MIDFMKIPASEAERLAYAEGFTGTAQLFARIADLEAERDELKEHIEQLQFIARRERAYGGDA